MKSNQIYRDNSGKISSKRITGMVLMLYFLVMTTLDGLDWYSANEMLLLSLLAVATTLLGIDSVTDIWKAKKTNNNNNNGYPTEQE